jgi:hypothetical protein
MAGSNSPLAEAGCSAPNDGTPLPAAALAGAASGKAVLMAVSFRNDLRSKGPGTVLTSLEFLDDMLGFSSFPRISSLWVISAAGG